MVLVKVVELCEISNFALRSIAKISMVVKLQSSKVVHLKLKSTILTRQNFEVWKQHFIATLELFLTMLGTELAHDP